MAMTYQNFASLGVNLNRQKYGPLDISNVFTSAADLQYYLTKGAYTEGVSEYWYKNANEKIVPYPYEGQVLATVIDGVVNVYTLSLDAEGNFQTQEIAGKIEVDGKTIVKDAEGKLSIVAPVDPDEKKTYNFSYANGVYSWVEVDTATAAGQAQAIQGLTDRTVALEEAINGKGEGEEHIAGLAEKVAALEAVDNATQAELDAYKEVVTEAIADALQDAKDYADAQDADTIYDDTDIKNRVKAIEDDYLKEADKYDDTALAARVKAIEDDYLTKADKYDDTELAGRVSTAEGKIADLEEAVEAIDFVDADELAAELAPYAKTADVNDALATKADKTALESLQSTVDAFLTGTGTEAALDSLKELIAYIDEHDGADLTEMVATIEGIEKKLDGIDTTVAAYVTAAIDALKIGDYAKASDLTALAGRVDALEAKPFDTYATKTEVQDVDAKFAQYTTTNDLNGLLADKADADSVVASGTFETFKTENTSAIATAKQEAIDAAKAAEEAKGYAVASDVANTYATKAMLETHEGEIENELLAYAKTADVNAELAKKIETGSIAHSSETAAEGVTVNGTQLNIIVDAYTKEETRNYVADVIRDMTGGESAADVLRDLNAHITTYTEKVGQIDAKDAAQDTAIAAALEQANKGIADAAKVAGDLVTANLAIAANERQIGVVDGKITTVNSSLTEKITALEGKDATIEGNITALQTAVSGHTTTITEQGTAIAALQDKDTELAALIKGNTNKFADYYTSAQVDAKVKEVSDAVGAIDLTPFAESTDVNAALDLKANVADVYTKDAADAAFMTQDEVDARINALIAASDPDGDGNVIKDIQNLVEYVENNAGEIASLVTATNANTNKLAGIESTVVDYVTSQIAKVVTPKASAEVTVAEDGTLGIGEVSTDKLVQGSKTLVLCGGDAEVTDNDDVE